MRLSPVFGTVVFASWLATVAPAARSQEDAPPSASQRLVERMIDTVYNEEQFDSLGSYFDAAFRDNGEPGDLEAIRETVAELHRSFSDFKVVVDEILASDTHVAAKLLYTGRFEHKYGRFNATHKPIQMVVLTFLHVKNGRLTERWSYANTDALLSGH